MDYRKEPLKKQITANKYSESSLDNYLLLVNLFDFGMGSDASYLTCDRLACLTWHRHFPADYEKKWEGLLPRYK